MAKANNTIYFVCVHPGACWFWDKIFNLNKRISLSIVLAFLLTMVSQTYPVCTEKFCYTIFAQFFTNPLLLLKPFAYSLIYLPALFTFALLFALLFAVFSVFSAVQKSGVVHEMFFPVVSLVIVAYMALAVSGAMSSLFLNAGLMECVNNDDCIRAGYIGETCTSVYRPVYTQYTPDMKPLEKCGCVENKCIGS
ncbi:MAG: hypothetical protein PHC66_04260 [Candidatus Nanoarchaeia archaeon]|nr:hypothetical protein [Candidatus Nanoarchaeia archaeon]MDD5239359.1 hypothetical protein [Candidatus Nanoarchaeia archaeon]